MHRTVYAALGWTSAVGVHLVSWPAIGPCLAIATVNKALTAPFIAQEGKP